MPTRLLAQMAHIQLCWFLQPQEAALVSAMGPKIIGFGPILLWVRDISHPLDLTERRWQRASPVICYRCERGFKCMKVRDGFAISFTSLSTYHNKWVRGLFLKYSFMWKMKSVHNRQCLAVDQQKSPASSRAEASWALDTRGKNNEPEYTAEWNKDKICLALGLR